MPPKKETKIKRFFKKHKIKDVKHDPIENLMEIYQDSDASEPMQAPGTEVTSEEEASLSFKKNNRKGSFSTQDKNNCVNFYNSFSFRRRRHRWFFDFQSRQTFWRKQRVLGNFRTGKN